MTPLAGQRVVVTRAAHQAEELAAPLRELGARVILLPMIGIAPPADAGPLERAARNANAYDWLVFTSANAVAALAAQMGTDGPPPSPRARIATVGAATRDAVAALGWRVDVAPTQFVAESLAESLAGEMRAGDRVLMPAAAVTRDVLAEALRGLGATVEVVEAYRNVVPEGAAAHAKEVFGGEPPPEWVTFASGSAVEHLTAICGAAALRRSLLASIGPVTTAALRRHDLTPAVEADPHTVKNLAAAIAGYEPALQR